MNMLDRSQQLVSAVAILLLGCEAAYATSGWDAYKADVGHYRISGHINGGGVWLLDPAGRQVNPPVLVAKDGLSGPPKYVLMHTHLLLIYGLRCGTVSQGVSVPIECTG